MLNFERHHERLASSQLFLSRFIRNFAVAVLVVGLALTIGMAGYAHFEHMNTIDAFLNASMILSGMGPAAELKTDGGKLFAGLYALASGLIVVAATGLVLAPVLHRILHHFHCDQSD